MATGNRDSWQWSPGDDSRLVKFARCFMGSQCDAEDVVQDVILKFADDSDSFKAAPTGSYDWVVLENRLVVPPVKLLFQAIKHTCINTRRGNSRRKVRETKTVGIRNGSLTGEPVSAELAPDERLEQDEIQISS